LLRNVIGGDNYTFPPAAFLHVSQRFFPANFPDFSDVSMYWRLSVCTLMRVVD
jgi:hypothetical protein